jgi:hypothetical protein
MMARPRRATHHQHQPSCPSLSTIPARRSIQATTYPSSSASTQEIANKILKEKSLSARLGPAKGGPQPFGVAVEES